LSLCEANANFSKKIEMLFLSFEKSTNTKTRMNSRVIVSQKSLAKQVLVNNLGLIPDLANVVKEFAFYDKVSQVSRNKKNEVITGLNMTFAPGSSHNWSIEGYGTMAMTGELIRYKHVSLRCVDSNHGLQFVICYNCGNYIFSESSSTPRILCACGLVDLTDDDDIPDEIIDEDAIDAMLEELEDDHEELEDDHEELEDEEVNEDDNDDIASVTSEEMLAAYEDYVAQTNGFENNRFVAEEGQEEGHQQRQEEGQEGQEEPIYFRASDAFEYGQEDQHQAYMAAATMAIIEEDDREEFRVSTYFNQSEFEEYCPEDDEYY
jgi:hypothetical protein